MTHTQLDLSVIVPAYNEQARIVPSLEKILSYLSAQSYSSEVIVVDDGSTDATAEVVRGFMRTHPSLRLVRMNGNVGKGGAVKKGVMNAGGKILFFTDADLSTPIEETSRFLEELKKFDVVIGSRSITGSNLLIHEPVYRELLGKLFNKFVQVLCVPGIVDTQCGAKMFTRDAAMKIFPEMQITRYSFDVEMLYLARRFSYRIKEMPVTWVYESNTRVKAFQDGPKMLLDLLKIRWIHRNLKV